MTSMLTRKFNTNCLLLNNRLTEEILELNDQQIIKKTHFFSGRYENIYVAKNSVTGLKQIIHQAHQYAAEILDRNINELKIGFWINIMQKGHTTTLHRHDDDDELLSGVYYVRVPENSGQFVYHVDGQKHALMPEQGAFLFFTPSLLHEVTEHQSDQARISIAFNIGPSEAEVES